MRIAEPISAEKANEGGGFEPWRPGTYDFEVHDAAEDTSKASGAEMIKLTLYVFNADGGKRTVFDYLVNSEKAQFKIRHFSEAVGLLHHYEKGELDVYDMVGKVGKLKLGIKAAQGDYPANNSVQDYIAMDPASARAAPRPVASRAAAPAARQPARVSGDLDDEIPF